MMDCLDRNGKEASDDGRQGSATAEHENTAPHDWHIIMPQTTTTTQAKHMTARPPLPARRNKEC